MRKFLLPIINLINVVLVSIVFGLGAQVAYTGAAGSTEDWYSTVWHPIEGGKANILGIIGFFLFVFAVAGIIIAFFPAKFRKGLNLFIGAALIAAGVLFLLTPAGGLRNAIDPEIELSGSLIAMAVLVFIAGAFSLGMAALELGAKKSK